MGGAVFAPTLSSTDRRGYLLLFGVSGIATLVVVAAYDHHGQHHVAYMLYVVTFIAFLYVLPDNFFAALDHHVIAAVSTVVVLAVNGLLIWAASAGKFGFADYVDDAFFSKLFTTAFSPPVFGTVWLPWMIFFAVFRVRGATCAASCVAFDVLRSRLRAMARWMTVSKMISIIFSELYQETQAVRSDRREQPAAWPVSCFYVYTWWRPRELDRARPDDDDRCTSTICAFDLRLAVCVCRGHWRR